MVSTTQQLRAALPQPEAAGAAAWVVLVRQVLLQLLAAGRATRGPVLQP